MTSLEMVQTWGALLASIGAFAMFGGTFHRMGQMKVTAIQWAIDAQRNLDRMADHSDTIEEQGQQLLMQSLTISRVEDKQIAFSTKMEAYHREVGIKLDSIWDKIEKMKLVT